MLVSSYYKNNIMKHFLFIVLVLSYSLSFASDSIKYTAIEKPLIANESAQLQKENSELREQNTEMAELFKWSISSILLIILALLGSSVFFNFRLSKKELENINKGLELDMRNLKIKLEKDISEKMSIMENAYVKNVEESKNSFLALEKEFNSNFGAFQNKTEKNISQKMQSLEELTRNHIEKSKSEFDLLVKEINSNIKNDNSKLIDRFQNQLDEFNTNYRQQITTIEKSLNSQFTGLEKRLEQTNENLLEKIKKTEEKGASNHDKITNELAYAKKIIQADIERNAGYMWEARGVFSNSFRSYVRECEIYTELNRDAMISLSLSSIKDMALKLKSIDESDRNSITHLFEKVPSKYDNKKMEILEILNKIENK